MFQPTLPKIKLTIFTKYHRNTNTSFVRYFVEKIKIINLKEE